MKSSLLVQNMGRSYVMCDANKKGRGEVAGCSFSYLSSPSTPHAQFTYVGMYLFPKADNKQKFFGSGDIMSFSTGGWQDWHGYLAGYSLLGGNVSFFFFSSPLINAKK